MAKVSFTVTRNGFVLHPGNDDESAKPFMRLEEGTEYVIDIKRQRSSPFHRLFFAWINTVFANQDRYDTPEQLRYAYLIRAGFVKHQIARMIHKMVDCPHCHYRHKVEIEEHLVVPDSMSYENKSQDEIEAVKNGMVEIAAQDGIHVPFDLR